LLKVGHPPDSSVQQSAEAEVLKPKQKNKNNKSLIKFMLTEKMSEEIKAGKEMQYQVRHGNNN